MGMRERDKLQENAPHESSPILRVGFMPGSFDPPHSGHLALAERASAAMNLAQVYFYVNSLNEDKMGISALNCRKEMVELLVRGSAGKPIPNAAYKDHVRDAGHDFLEDIERLRYHFLDPCMIVMIRGSDYFSPDIIGRYPAVLWEVPHVIGIRDPAHRMFDFSRFRSVRFVECPTISSTQMRANFRENSLETCLDASDEVIREYCLKNDVYR